uniref:Cathepsin B-S n=1 Tax=Astegopteryx styracophila TaxID=488727 RepID=B5MEY7_9HEMI|nr:cathepsin B-S [Astegopteryx styracophila]
MVGFITIGCVILVSVHWTEQTSQFLSDERIEYINKIAKTWKAERYFPANMSKEYITGLLGSRGYKNYLNEVEIKKDDPLYTKNNNKIKHFDARENWKICKQIGHVRDQGNCGSCWAFGTTGAFADRLCVATGGGFNEQLSAEKLTFCCWTCGLGCQGGNPIKAWKYFKRRGITTGGDYGSNEGCAPYKVPPCYDDQGEFLCQGKPTEHNHKCPRACYGNSTVENRYKVESIYVLDSFKTIEQDIRTYGPVEASFDVYDDFITYKSGIYQKTPNALYVGGHSVKLIGWGEEDGIPYWLLVNSWSKFWGEQGTFRIIKGRNECGIERSATAGIPSRY